MIKRSRKEIGREVLTSLLLTGAVAIAVTSPYFMLNLLKGYKKWKKYKNKKIYDAFYYLKKQGFINIEKSNHQIYISLTRKGKEKAGKYQIDDLFIKKQKKWDNKWRMIIFDIPENYKIKREAFRGKIKELGFYPLQKSVWIYPYPCQKELKLLQDFFNFPVKNFRLIEARDIGNDDFLRKYFNLK